MQRQGSSWRRTCTGTYNVGTIPGSWYRAAA